MTAGTSSTEARRLNRWIVLVAGAAAVGILYWVSETNYLLFHSLVELGTVTIAYLLLSTALNLLPFSRNYFLAFLGITMASAGTVDIVHALAYKGMGVFPEATADLPTQLWILARYAEAAGFLIAPVFVTRTFRVRRMMLLWGGVAVLGLLAVFSGNFPQCYVEGEGLTSFKILSEYVISGILVLAGVHLWYYRESLDRTVFFHMLLVLALTIGAELSFTQYVSVFGPFNFVGHISKLAAFLLVYRMVVRTMLARPMAALRDLIPICSNCKAVRDDSGSWRTLEAFLGTSMDSQVTHGLCPQCATELYPELFDQEE